MQCYTNYNAIDGSRMEKWLGKLGMAVYTFRKWMIAITGAFAFTDVMPVKQLGVGIALAIFIDATIVRMVLVPSP